MQSERGVFISEKKEWWDSGLDPIGLMDLVPFAGRSYIQQHLDFFKMYCDAILGNEVKIQGDHSAW